MATYYVDDGGDNTTGASWATAYLSFADLVAAHATLADGDVVYVGHDTVDGHTYTANLSITGPTSGLATIISADNTSGTPPTTYTTATSIQCSVNDGAYALYFVNAISAYGLKVEAGTDINIQTNATAPQSFENCTFLPSKVTSGRYFNCQGALNYNNHRLTFKNCTIDLGNDTGSSANVPIQLKDENCYFSGCTVANGSNRTGAIIAAPGEARHNEFSACDFSSCSNASCEIISPNAMTGIVVMSNCKTKTTPTYTVAADSLRAGRVTITNSGSSYDATQTYVRDAFGEVASSTSIYRNNGARVEATSVGWTVTSSSIAKEQAPFYTPWIYGVITDTGSKTFTIYISTSTVADLYDDEVWIEVEYTGTSGSALSTLTKDQRATILTTHALQSDDTTSTWTGITATYKQSLGVTATVNQTGLYRARVALGKASTTLYVDPKVTIS